MEKLDFEAMSVDDLWMLHERIVKVLSERILAEKRQLEARLLRLNRGPAAGSYELEPTRANRQRRKYPKVFPKYQNPKAPFETWSGRGKQPRWLVSALKAGHEIGDFELSNASARSPAPRLRGH